MKRPHLTSKSVPLDSNSKRAGTRAGGDQWGLARMTRMRSALFLVVYIRQLGAEPEPVKNFDFRKWETAVNKQYLRLRKSRSANAVEAARLRGRKIIGEKGLLVAAADSLERPKSNERLRCLVCAKWTWPTLEAALPALEALRRAPGARNPGFLSIYKCPRDYGWHLGHTYVWSGGSLCVGEHK